MLPAAGAREFSAPNSAPAADHLELHKPADHLRILTGMGVEEGAGHGCSSGRGKRVWRAKLRLFGLLRELESLTGFDHDPPGHFLSIRGAIQLRFGHIHGEEDISRTGVEESICCFGQLQGTGLREATGHHGDC